MKTPRTPDVDLATLPPLLRQRLTEAEAAGIEMIQTEEGAWLPRPAFLPEGARIVRASYSPEPIGEED